MIVRIHLLIFVGSFLLLLVIVRMGRKGVDLRRSVAGCSQASAVIVLDDVKVFSSPLILITIKVKNLLILEIGLFS